MEKNIKVPHNIKHPSYLDLKWAIDEDIKKLRRAINVQIAKKLDEKIRSSKR